jgi:hypothetical protein
MNSALSMATGSHPAALQILLLIAKRPQKGDCTYILYNRGRHLQRPSVKELAGHMQPLER